MTIKDWKKVKTESWLIRFRKNNRVLDIFDVNRNFLKSKRSYYVTEKDISEKFPNVLKNSIINKSQALKFAKNYMRKH